MSNENQLESTERVRERAFITLVYWRELDKEKNVSKYRSPDKTNKIGWAKRGI